MIDLREKALKLPNLPGCYLMLKNKQIIYIGKAKDLKKRVLSYFGVTSGKTYFLMQQVDDFDFFLTSNEAEALLLENNLIKKHNPKYNVSLKDDRRFPFIQVNFNESFPTLKYIRKPVFKKGIKTFGPFVTGSRIPEIIKILNDHFELRTCNHLAKSKNPCLRFHLKLCSAPCFKEQTNYKDRLNSALTLFSNKKEIIKQLTGKMEEFSKKEEFEAAAKIRDDLLVIDDFFSHTAKQKVEYLSVKNLDVISYYEGKEAIDIVVLIVRNGFLIGKQNFFIYDREELIDLIFGYYVKSGDIPPLIDWRGDILLLESLQLIKKGIKLYSFDALFKLSHQTAIENQKLRESFKYTRMEASKKLARLIKSRPLYLIEAYDVAIFSGKSPTASKIVFYQGYPHKKEYRYYLLTERPEGNNDFAMLEEVLDRRLKEGNLPDLFVVDGGRPQLRVFDKVLKHHKIDIPIVAIAKSKGDKEERIYFKDEEFILKEDLAILSLITAIRDEAHRFAQKLHKKHEKQRIFNA